MSAFDKVFKGLEEQIQLSYEEGVTVVEAERLAGQFLHAQMQISSEIKKADLSARMHKSGLKAVRAAVYMEASKPVDGKKPTEAAIGALVDTHEVVQLEQDALDTAEVERDELERQYDIMINGHIFMRGIAKGNFNG
jgi:hypothetical protein